MVAWQSLSIIHIFFGFFSGHTFMAVSTTTKTKGLYYKCFMIVIYNHNNSAIVIYDCNDSANTIELWS